MDDAIVTNNLYVAVDGMTVADLRTALQGLPDDMRVMVIDERFGFMEQMLSAGATGDQGVFVLRFDSRLY
jgi:hypothetical protein